MFQPAMKIGWSNQRCVQGLVSLSSETGFLGFSVFEIGTHQGTVDVVLDDSVGAAIAIMGKKQVPRSKVKIDNVTSDVGGVVARGEGAPVEAGDGLPREPPRSRCPCRWWCTGHRPQRIPDSVAASAVPSATIATTTAASFDAANGRARARRSMTCATLLSSDPSTELSWFSSTSERRNRKLEQNFVERRWFRGLLTFNSGLVVQQTGRPAGRIRLDTFSLSHVTYTRDTTHRSLVVVGHALGEHLLPEARRLRVLLLQSVFFNIADWQALELKNTTSVELPTR